MKNSAHAGANAAFLLLLTLGSALSMLWLLWRHPIPTLIAALIALAGFGLSACFARPSDAEGGLEQPQSPD